LSNNDESLPHLINKVSNSESLEEKNVEDKIFHLSKIPSVVKVLEDYNFEQYPN
jgi:hypothetical protein